MNLRLSKRAFFRVSIALAGLSLVVACGSDDDAALTETPDAAAPSERDASSAADSASPQPDAWTEDADGGGPLDFTPTCNSPVHFTADATAKARAVTALGTLSGTATLEWSDVRGTLTSISGLTTTPDCADSTASVYDALFDYLEASPDLFQIDRTEWKPDDSYTCADITGFQLLVIRRQKLGPYDLHNDVFSAVADVQDGHVIFRNFSGTYIPKPSTALLDEIAKCTDLPDDTLLAIARAQPFTCELFAPAPAPMCTIDGSSTYSTKANDTVAFESPSELLWEENTALEFHRQRAITVSVAQPNQIADLLRSSANCADVDGNPNVGWVRTLDVANGKILVDHDTPDPFCSVCFAAPTDRDPR